MKRPGQPKSTWKRRGVVIALTAICLITLLLCAALAIDVGYICALTAEQQNNADAGALAGASGLQDQDSTAARSRALSLLAQNQEPQGYRSLSDQIIDFGWFDSVNLVFHPLDDPTNAFAIRVRIVIPHLVTPPGSNLSSTHPPSQRLTNAMATSKLMPHPR